MNAYQITFVSVCAIAVALISYVQIRRDYWREDRRCKAARAYWRVLALKNEVDCKIAIIQRKVKDGATYQLVSEHDILHATQMLLEQDLLHLQREMIR